MFRLLRMVAWTMTAIAMLLLFTSRNVLAQDAESNEVRADDQAVERALADRYEQILRSRPQVGTALDKVFEFHASQGTLAELCERLELTANSGEDGNLFQLLGLLQLRRGLGDDAAANLTRAELLLPGEPLASLYRSRALTLNRQYAPALAALRSAVDRKPSQAVVLEILKELRRFKDRGVDVEVAAELLSNIEQQFSNSLQVNEKLADCFIELGRPEAARPVYEKIIELTRDPLRRIEVRMQFARLKIRLGEPEQSLIELEQLASQVKPQSWLHASLLEQIEQLTEELHGIEGLIERYERVLLKQPDDVASMLRLAKVLRNRSRFEEAKNWVSKAIHASPTQPEPLLAMADLMEETEQFNSASEFMQQLVQLDPSNADYIVRWGHLVAHSPNIETPISSTSDTDSAVRRSSPAAIWRRLLIGHENDPTKAIQVAELLRSISLPDEAIKLYEQAVQVSGGRFEFSELLGEYLLQIDRREEARKVFASALTAAGDDREGLMHLSQVLTRFTFPDEALKALEKACQKRADFGDLIQFANLQSESEGIEAAIDTLNRAAVIAEGSADLAMLWDAQAKAYKRISDLPKLVVELEKNLQTGNLNSSDSLQRLAIMQAANNQLAQAAATALKASLVQPDSIRTWLLAARLQHVAGLSLREIESLGVLCKLDTRHAPDYLQRIATIHFQQNRVEQALNTMEQIFALPTATLQNFQMATSFCLQAKRLEQAAETLRRATQVFPRDRSAWLMLARQLAELKNYAKAIDAAWHVLEVSRDQAQQREAIDLLVTLHPGEPSIAILLAGLKRFGVEHEKESDAKLWSAWVMLEGHPIQGSSELIADLLGRTDAKPALLFAAMELAARDRDYVQAAAIQRRLCRVDATVANQLKLGQLLWLAGAPQAAAIEWKNVMRARSNDALVTVFAKELLDKANWNMVTNLVDLGIESKVRAWDFLVIGIYANIQSKNLSRAAELSQQLLAMDLPPAAMIKAADASEFEVNAVPLTAKDRLAWLEYAGAWQSILNVVDATRAGYRTNQSNPRASQAAAVRHLALQRGASLRTSQITRFNVQCFAEARALAVLARFGRLNQQSAGVVDEWARYVAKAIVAKNVEQLWDCVLVMEPASCREVSFTATGATQYRDTNDRTMSRYVEVLDALIALDEQAAVELAINEIVLRRQLQHQMADRLLQAVPAMDAKELARLQGLVQRVDVCDTATAFAGHVTLAIELLRSQRIVEGQQVLGSALAAVADISRLATCARQFQSNDKTTQLAVSRMLLRAFELELEAGSESNDLAFAISTYRSGVRADSRSQELLFEMIQLQAKRVEGISADLLFSDSRTNESRRAYRNFRKPLSALPDRSSLLSASLRAALVDSAPDELTRFVANMKSREAITQSELAVRRFAASVAHSILNDPDRALALLAQAKEQRIATEIVSLYEVWLLVVNQRLEAARDVLNKIKPPNESILRECELWKMDLGSKLGNREEAQRAARALTNLPLSVHENAEVAAILK